MTRYSETMLAIICALPLLLPPAASAAAKAGTVGVIEVEYEMASQGERKRGIEYQTEWRGKRLLKIAFEVVAREVQSAPVTLAGAPKGKSSIDTRVEAASKRNEGAHNDLEAAMKGCANDSACQARVAMSFMRSTAFADSTALARERSGVGMPPRYQFWSPVGANGKLRALSGSYSIDQYSKTRTYDPECGKTQNICTAIHETKGSGALSPEQLEMTAKLLSMPGLMGGGVVVDVADKLVTVGIPPPAALIEVTETARSDTEGSKTTTKKQSWLEQAQKWDEGLGAADLPYVEPMNALQGEQVLTVKNGYAPKLTMRWRFFVKR